MRLKKRLELARADDLTFGVFLKRFGRVRGPRLLVDEVGGVRLTYAEAADLVARAAGALRQRFAAAIAQRGADTDMRAAGIA
jgi:hypothetical protein